MAQSALTVAGSLTPVAAQQSGLQPGAQSAEIANFAVPASASRIEALVGVSSVDRAAASFYGRRDKLPSLHDYALGESGFHLSFGFRKRAAIGKLPRASAVNAELRTLLASPPITQALRATDGVKRKLPMAFAGFTQLLGERAALRFDAGAMMIRPTRAIQAFADAGRAASRLGAVAQVSFLRKF